jgi:hypothetical protein
MVSRISHQELRFSAHKDGEKKSFSPEQSKSMMQCVKFFPQPTSLMPYVATALQWWRMVGSRGYAG